MHSLSPHLMVATALAARHLSGVRPTAAAQLAIPAAGGLTMAIVVLVVTVLTAMAWAVRGVLALISQFLQVAATMMSVLITMVLAVVLAAALFVHH